MDINILRHSVSHILAQAVKRLYPNTKLAIGPSIENGFYYDFDSEEAFSDESLKLIEKEMKKIIRENLKFERMVLSKNDARKLLKEKEEPYKIELLEDLGADEEISFYKQGDFIDLCRGPHIEKTSQVKAFKLMKVSGAYWKGSEKNKMLQRIYGVAFSNKEELESYLTMLEEAKKRDHRKLGKELDLFSIKEEGPGFPFFHPKGMILINVLQDFWREMHYSRGYDEIKTPIMLDEELWHRSGHIDLYKENMYFSQIDNKSYAIKPMSCPGAILVYKDKIHSYKEFPLRYAELGLVHRHEQSGALHGLMRVRAFTQDDAHIFLEQEQIGEELLNIITLITDFYNAMGFKYHIELSTRPDNSLGSDEVWEIATNALKDALSKAKLPYVINEGDGAFYGPKIDFHLEDSIGRDWQCGTIQLDFNLPERFDLSYIGKDGEKHRPIMIHRVLMGSLERFIGILIEHYAGKLPVWLSPVQVMIMNIGENQSEFVKEVQRAFKEKGIRASIDIRNEKISYKIREAQVMKIPYMIIVGDKEMNENMLSVRSIKEGDLGVMKPEIIIDKIKDEIEMKVN